MPKKSKSRNYWASYLWQPLYKMRVVKDKKKEASRKKCRGSLKKKEQ